MPRLFLDANVLFSAAYGSRGLLRLWESARSGEVTLLTSGYAVEEARRNLRHPDQWRRLAELLSDVSVVGEAPPDASCPAMLPEKDRPLLLAAIAAGATHFLTGDLRHFGRYRNQAVAGVRICTPRDCLGGCLIVK
ncbi:MAG: PIN domain-containing protein [Bacillota bacterium]|nr:PIN domain-containing protein [Bacillota bacterium]